MNGRKFTSAFMVCMLLALTAVSMTGMSQGKRDKEVNATLGVYGNLRREQIDYTRKEDNSFYFDGGLPDYHSTDANGCAPVAAATVTGYYTQWYQQLIPNHKATMYYNNKLMMTPQSREVDNTINKLTTKMGGTKNGVTMPNMKAGLTSYVKDAGLKTSYNSTMKNNYFLGIFLLSTDFDYSAYVREINAKRPVVLALDTFHVLNIGTSGKMDEFSYVYPTSKSAHSMVGYGYRTIKYYRNETVSVWSPTWSNPFRIITTTAEVCFRSETLLMVATGHQTTGYLNINHSFHAFDAFGISINT